MWGHILSRKCKRFTCSAVLLGLFSAGCATNRDTGTAVGGVGGAVAGAALGSTVRAPVAGAIIGGVGGMIAGNLLGGEKDRRDAERAAAARYVSPEKIVMMAHKHVEDDLIIGEIRSTGSVYR